MRTASFDGLVRRAALVGALGLLFAGCDGCKSSAKVVPPTRFIPADADAVLELRDIGSLVKARTEVLKRFGTLVSNAQMEGVQKELVLSFGFDPSTAEGLAQAGLPSTGRIAAQIAKSGRGALWVIPVTDAKKFAPVLMKIVKARSTVDKTEVKKIGGVEATVYLTQFGPDTVTVAAHAFLGGYALIGAGQDATALLERSLSLEPTKSIETSAEYQALTKSLDANWDARMISPTGGETLVGALRTASRSIPEIKALVRDELKSIKSVGWTVAFSADGLKVHAKARLTPEGQELSKKIFAAAAAPGDGVRAVAVPQAIAHIQAALHPATLLDLIAPSGSPARSQLDRATARMKRDLGTDLETEVFPLLTGHAGLAVGLGDMSEISFQKLVGNPRGAVWTALAVGVKEPAAAVEIEKRLDPGLKARGLEIVTRKVADKTIRSVVPPTRGDVAVAPLVETTGFGEAWLFANEPALMEQVVSNQAAPSALGGRPGLYAELSFRRFNEQMSTFRYGDLPILYRSVLAKVMDTVRLLDNAKLRIHPDADGVDMKAELTIVPIGTAPAQ